MLGWLVRRFKRPPDLQIGVAGDPYMLRWYIFPRGNRPNIYLHCVLKDDDDRALHDHPYHSLSLILRGSYYENTPAGRFYREPGDLIYRPAAQPHRLEVCQGPVWTLFFTGPRFREWGFHCPRGWVPWQDFVTPTEYGQTGRGCD